MDSRIIEGQIYTLSRRIDSDSAYTTPGTKVSYLGVRLQHPSEIVDIFLECRARVASGTVFTVAHQAGLSSRIEVASSTS
jgi:hypothetical protein